MRHSFVFKAGSRPKDARRSTSSAQAHAIKSKTPPDTRSVIHFASTARVVVKWTCGLEHQEKGGVVETVQRIREAREKLDTLGGSPRCRC